MKIKQCSLGGDLAPAWRHWCPGCKQNHVIYIDPRSQANGHHWRFNGNQERPTFEPSINIVGRCHYFITDGRIRFCEDSRHELAGKTVDLPNLTTIGEDWE